MVDNQIDMKEDLKNKVKEGWLSKESKFLRTWRKYTSLIDHSYREFEWDQCEFVLMFRLVI